MDRNDAVQIVVVIVHASLSARRAWIEIAQGRRVSGCPLSLSARRAWIEIVISAMTGQISVVALRKESVDRNSCSASCRYVRRGRSPQGERG